MSRRLHEGLQRQGLVWRVHVEEEALREVDLAPVTGVDVVKGGRANLNNPPLLLEATDYLKIH